MEMSLLPPARPVELASRPRGLVRWALSRIRAYTGVQPPPVARNEQALYGFSQPLIVAVGVAPFVGLASLVPGLGQYLSAFVLTIWGVHWIVADAFDDAQVLQPGETLRESLEHDRNARPPWFVRIFLRAAEKVPLIRRPLRWFARLCDRLAMDSRGEIATMEAHKPITAGFALST